MTRFYTLTFNIITNYFKDKFQKNIIIYTLMMDNVVSNDDTYRFKIHIKEEYFGTKDYAVIIPKEAYEIKDRHYKQIKLIKI